MPQNSLKRKAQRKERIVQDGRFGEDDGGRMKGKMGEDMERRGMRKKRREAEEEEERKEIEIE
jgi:hypothetical protein